MDTIRVKLALGRETKGAVRFEEVDDNGNPIDIPRAKIGTIYIRKTTIKPPYPTRITVIITEGQ